MKNDLLAQLNTKKPDRWWKRQQRWVILKQVLDWYCIVRAQNELNFNIIFNQLFNST